MRRDDLSGGDLERRKQCGDAVPLIIVALARQGAAVGQLQITLRSLQGALRRRGLQRVFPDGSISYPGIGIISGSEANARHTITAVIDGTPAQQAGLRPGDEIIAADGTPFEPIGSFRGKVGKTVVLEVRRGGSGRQVSVVPVDLEPNKMFLRGLETSARLIESNGRRIAPNISICSMPARQQCRSLTNR
jgi:C-terminal processing protease CtpA/Prc